MAFDIPPFFIIFCLQESQYFFKLFKKIIFFFFSSLLNKELINELDMEFFNSLLSLKINLVKSFIIVLSKFILLSFPIMLLQNLQILIFLFCSFSDSSLESKEFFLFLLRKKLSESLFCSFDIYLSFLSTDKSFLPFFILFLMLFIILIFGMSFIIILFMSGIM